MNKEDSSQVETNKKQNNRSLCWQNYILEHMPRIDTGDNSPCVRHSSIRRRNLSWRKAYANLTHEKQRISEVSNIQHLQNDIEDCFHKLTIKEVGSQRRQSRPSSQEGQSLLQRPPANAASQPSPQRANDAQSRPSSQPILELAALDVGARTASQNEDVEFIQPAVAVPNPARRSHAQRQQEYRDRNRTTSRPETINRPLTNTERTRRRRGQVVSCLERERSEGERQIVSRDARVENHCKQRVKGLERYS